MLRIACAISLSELIAIAIIDVRGPPFLFLYERLSCGFSRDDFLEANNVCELNDAWIMFRAKVMFCPFGPDGDEKNDLAFLEVIFLFEGIVFAAWSAFEGPVPCHANLAGSSSNHLNRIPEGALGPGCGTFRSKMDRNTMIDRCLSEASQCLAQTDLFVEGESLEQGYKPLPFADEENGAKASTGEETNPVLTNIIFGK